MDSNNDGVGDIQGFINRLDYLDRLGVDCLWLLPFYPTPNRDNGYDVTDYYSVDPHLGTLGDFELLLREDPDIFAYHQTQTERDQQLLVVLNFNDRHPPFVLPPDIEYEDAELMLANYDPFRDPGLDKFDLQPYEARISIRMNGLMI